MPPLADESLWSFKPVYELMRSLSSPAAELPMKASVITSTPPKDKPPDIDKASTEALEDGGISLGDFRKIWDHLGAPHDTPPPVIIPVSRPPSPPFQSILDRDEYNSDGAVYCPPSAKGVKWRDEVVPGAADLTDTAPEDQSGEAPDATRLTKKQRKKLRQKEARMAKAQSDFESEGELNKVNKKAPAAKASVHAATASAPAAPAKVAKQPQSPVKPKHKKNDSKSSNISDADIQAAKDAVALSLKKEPQKSHQRENKQPASNGKSNGQTVPKSAAPLTPAKKGADNKQPVPPLTGKKAEKKVQGPTPATPKPTKANAKANAAKPLQAKTEPRPALPKQKSAPQVPVTPTPAMSQMMIPQQVQMTTMQGHQQYLPAQMYTPQPLLPAMIPPQSFLQMSQMAHLPVQPVPFVLPATLPPQQPSLTLRERDDRYWSLRLKLLNDFPAERSWLVKLVQHADHTSHPNGVHVFIDFSNIYIGFKSRLGWLMQSNRIKGRGDLGLDFESLVLLLERGRPVAKRALAGSLPFMPEFDLAKRIGYEASILEKVRKSKELTQRQKFFKYLDEKRNIRSRTPVTNGMDMPSDEWKQPEDFTEPQFAPEKLVEQGVDEILHLKMLESMVDTDKPSTMVLATGDAAEAEYSSGFMRMVERALTKGWRVEVVAFHKSISQAYRKADFNKRWAGRFVCIELDGYIEELVDT